jgi:hypothetical protein
MRDQIKGVIFFIAGVGTWSGLGRKVLETYIIERILHMLNPLIDASIVFLVEYALPVALGAYGIYLLMGLKHKPADIPVAIWTRRQLSFIDPSHLIWIGFSGAALFMAVGFSGLVWQHFKPEQSAQVVQSPQRAPGSTHTVPSVSPPAQPAMPAPSAPPSQAFSDTVPPEDVPRLKAVLADLEKAVGPSLAKNLDQTMELVENWQLNIASKGKGAYLSALQDLWRKMEGAASGIIVIGAFREVIRLP